MDKMVAKVARRGTLVNFSFPQSFQSPTKKKESKETQPSYMNSVTKKRKSSIVEEPSPKHLSTNMTHDNFSENQKFNMNQTFCAANDRNSHSRSINLSFHRIKELKPVSKNLSPIKIKPLVLNTMNRTGNFTSKNRKIGDINHTRVL